MSDNFPISNGGSYATDRSPAVEQTAKPKEISTTNPNNSTPISNLSDLKQAELRGENHTISDEQLIKAIEKAIKAVQGPYTSLEFSVHEKTKQIMVKVMDKETGQILREIPPEKTLDFVAKLWEMAGVLIDEKR
jgi:flagellar protein FlaG